MSLELQSGSMPTTLILRKAGKQTCFFFPVSSQNTCLPTALPPACLVLKRVMEEDKWRGWGMMYQSGKTLEQTIDKQEVNERQMDVEVGRVVPKDNSWQERKQVAQWLQKQSVTLRCTWVVSSRVTDCGVYWSSSTSQNICYFRSLFLSHDFQFEVFSCTYLLFYKAAVLVIHWNEFMLIKTQYLDLNRVYQRGIQDMTLRTNVCFWLVSSFSFYNLQFM